MDETMKDSLFRGELISFASTMTALVECSLVLHGGNSTLADVFFGMGRMYEVTARQGGPLVMFALEKRFKSYILALLFHPRFSEYGKSIVRSGRCGLSIPIIISWVEFYFSKWLKDTWAQFSSEPFQVRLAVCAWFDVSHSNLSLGTACSLIPLDFGEW